MRDDLVKRLRANHLDECYDAIDRIETLQAQLESTLKDRALIIAERDRLRDAQADAWDAGREAAAQCCEAQKAEFLSPEYAVNQPISSHSERFACGLCTAAIRALPNPHNVGKDET